MDAYLRRQSDVCGYDTNSYPLYTVAGLVPAQENGKYVYISANGELFTSAYDYDTLMNSTYDLWVEYITIFFKYGSFIPYYYYPKGSVTIAPDGENGMNVTYMPYSNNTGTGSISFALPVEDGTGYGIVDRYTRVLLADDTQNGLSKGTLLYLNKNGNVIVYCTPEGLIRVYEQETYLGYTGTGADNTPTDEIYSEIYQDESDAYRVHLSKNARFMVHQVATGVYLTDRSISTTPPSTIFTPRSFYFNSDYFTQEGNVLEKLRMSSPDAAVTSEEYVYLTNELLLVRWVLFIPIV